MGAAGAYIEMVRDLRVVVSPHRLPMLQDFKWFPQVMNEGKLIYAKAMVHLVNEHGVRRRTTVLMHRLIAKAPPRMYVDHDDNDGLNNTDSNLIVCSNTYNQCNRRPSSVTGYKGVCKYRDTGKYQVTIPDFRQRNENKKARTLWIGVFDNAMEGARAYDRKALEMYGPFFPINFPLSDYPEFAEQAVHAPKVDPMSDIPFGD